jgi:hypothetical protein
MNAENSLGSARVSRVGDGVLAVANFSWTPPHTGRRFTKDCFGEAPKPAREARALPGPKNDRHS